MLLRKKKKKNMKSVGLFSCPMLSVFLSSHTFTYVHGYIHIRFFNLASETNKFYHLEIWVIKCWGISYIG